jgi:uncharacterized protein with GYD domain
MATFFLFGKYSAASLKAISARRTQAASTVVKRVGGEIKGSYALLGEHDLVLIVDLPGIAEALKCSLVLARQTGISFTTAPAISVEQFDKLAGAK